LKCEIVAYEKREENSNIFEDNFYIDSVERYNVKYKAPPATSKTNSTVPTTAHNSAHATGTHQEKHHNGTKGNINGDSGASGGGTVVVVNAKNGGYVNKGSFK
jgi:hypothetical protein